MGTFSQHCLSLHTVLVLPVIRVLPLTPLLRSERRADSALVLAQSGRCRTWAHRHGPAWGHLLLAPPGKAAQDRAGPWTLGAVRAAQTCCCKGHTSQM